MKWFKRKPLPITLEIAAELSQLQSTSELQGEEVWCSHNVCSEVGKKTKSVSFSFDRITYSMPLSMYREMVKDKKVLDRTVEDINKIMESKLTALLTDEFLDTLLIASKTRGWMVGHRDSPYLIRYCFGLAGRDAPDMYKPLQGNSK